MASVHGKKDGSLDDVELLLDVAKKIDEFEKENSLSLGPSMLNPIRRKPLKGEQDADEQLEEELGAHIKVEGKPTVLQKFSKQCQVCLRMFYNESKYEEDQEEHSKLIDLSGSMHCPSCYVKVAKLEINQHYLDDHPELKSACCLHCEGILLILLLS